MKIHAITMTFNEEVLLPYYLKHYDWVDQINVLFDTDSTDRSLSILNNHPKVNIIPFSFPDGLDDHIKVHHFNTVYQDLDCDFVILTDSDEFLFVDRQTIESLSDYPLYNARSGYVFRHTTEKDLDINESIKYQRRYGEWTGRKPMIARAKQNIKWTPGNHNCNIIAQDIGLVYAHWSMADPSFLIERKLKNRRDRMSAVNVKERMGFHLQGINEQDIMNECKQHENDERLW